MPLVIPPGFVNAHVLIQLTGDPELMETALGYEIDVDPFSQDNSDDLIAGMAGIIQDFMVNTYTVVGGYCIVGNDGDDIRFDSIASEVGTQGSASVPQNTATLIRKTTAVGGRRGRGRMFIPGIAESVVNNQGVLTTAAVDQFNVSAALLRVPSAFTGDANVVDGGVLFHESAPTTPTAITALIVQTTCATQRRRLRR